eukprot:TRINITY_DN9378_c0_g1_i1.p1 TRINITY_DN9378_c0_g1~~TRINITY_DN9378_c0_g1_i1.p1  ORF type:complete len:189 (+),score=66.35 TRINITY_DN9378_c0_g1_i1:47-613(+)
MALRLYQTCSAIRGPIRHLLATPPRFQVSACPVSQYNSSISLDKLYPDSKTVKASPPQQVDSVFNGFIPIQDLNISYSSSIAGEDSPATKVDIRFHVDSAAWLSTAVKQKIVENLGSDLTRDGWLVGKSDRTRSRTLNQADALEKLRSNIRLAVENPCEAAFTALKVETARKQRLKAARQRLHVKIGQ